MHHYVGGFNPRSTTEEQHGPEHDSEPPDLTFAIEPAVCRCKDSVGTYQGASADASARSSDDI